MDINSASPLEIELLKLAENLVIELGELPQRRKLSLKSSLQHDLGLDSLGRAELVTRIEKKWRVRLSEQLLAEAETLGDLYRALDEARKTAPRKAIPFKETLIKSREKRGSVDFPRLAKAKTIIAVLQEQAFRRPTQPYIYFQKENGEEDILTYGQLLETAELVAAHLVELGLKPGETVALMLPTDLNFFYVFFGILLASGIPVPIYPPLRPQQLESYARQEANILHNAEIRFLITFAQAELLSRLLQGFAPSLQQVLTVDLLLEPLKKKLKPPLLKGEDLALIQYTSGSTATPKGVALSHYNLLTNIRAFGEAIAVSPDDVAVSWLPLYHDFGLIGMVLGTLYYGIPLILLSPLSFLSRPEKWLWAIHRHRATLTAAPNFAYELCVRKADAYALEGLDLSCLRMAANGAETIYPKTYERFLAKFKSFGFRAESFFPVYGLAEATVGLTTSPLHRAPRIDRINRQLFEEEKQAVPLDNKAPSAKALDVISCGKPLPGHYIRIVDEQGRSLTERFVGHLQFQGPSAMQGYYNNPEATKEIYHDGWYDTGDFAYISEGELFLTGREKDLIIKAGRNIYPTVIEEAVSDLPGVRRGCVIAFSEKDPAKGTEKVIIVAETNVQDRHKREALRQAISNTLIHALDLAPDVLILVPARTVPKTSSGKLQRSACKEMYLKGRLRPVPFWLQLLKLGLSSIKVKGSFFFSNALKVLYTGYLVLVLALAIPLFWGCLKLLPASQSRQLARRTASLLRILSGCRLEVVGRDYLEAEKPLIFAANHSSYIDAILLMGLLPPDTRFVGKKELFSLPLLGGALRKMQHVPVDRLDFTQGLRVTEKLETLLKEKNSLLIFPEGTFSYAAGLRPFKLGAFKIATDTKTAVCPLALRGTRQILRANTYLLKPGKIKVTIGEPIYPQGDEWQDTLKLKTEVRDFIAAHCGELSLDFTDKDEGSG